MTHCLRLCTLMALLSFPVVGLTSCTRPVSVVTPVGAAAFTANEILIRVERLQDAAIAANKNGSLSTEAARQIVFVTVNLAELADAATQGWQATARQTWAQAKTELAILRPSGSFAVLAAAIDEALGVTP